MRMQFMYEYYSSQVFLRRLVRHAVPRGQTLPEIRQAVFSCTAHSPRPWDGQEAMPKRWASISILRRQTWPRGCGQLRLLSRPTHGWFIATAERRLARQLNPICHPRGASPPALNFQAMGEAFHATKEPSDAFTSSVSLLTMALTPARLNPVFAALANSALTIEI